MGDEHHRARCGHRLRCPQETSVGRLGHGDWRSWIADAGLRRAGRVGELHAGAEPNHDGFVRDERARDQELAPVAANGDEAPIERMIGHQPLRLCDRHDWHSEDGRRKGAVR